jgi:precorrin-6B methylase 2
MKNSDNKTNIAAWGRKTIRRFLYNITGINSIKAALNPITYLDRIFLVILCRRVHMRVLANKFEGMYLERANSSGSEYAPKLLGTYEIELDDAFKRLCNRDALLVDLGSDDGYYAIGLTRSGAVASSLAIECEEQRCERLQRNINSNGVNDRVTILRQKISDGNQLLELIRKHPGSVLIKCDIEGGEYDIFDESTLNSFAALGSSLIIETHLSESLESSLIRRMTMAGFSVKIIEQAKRGHLKIGSSDKITRLLCNIFGSRWSNEARPSFNRWVIASRQAN